MTEMLGVLAIVGVLSIGALVGLKYAFMKHQSNLIIEDVKLAGFIVKDGLFETLPLTEEKSLTGYFTPQTSYPFTTFKETDTSYAVVIDGVAENLCLDLKKRKVEWLEEIRANGQENTCRAGDTNSMSFFFNESLNTELTGCQNDSECGECGRCENRKCVFDIGEVSSGNRCISCKDSQTGIGNATLSSCQQCGNRFFDGDNALNGGCYLCSSKNTLFYVRQSDCLGCGNRYFIAREGDFSETGEQKGRCYFCEGTVTPDGTGCEWSCPAGQFGSLNECIDCDSTTNGGQSSRNSCQQCGNRFFDGDNALNGGCYLCSSKNTLFYVRQSDCLGCGNRYFIAREGDFSETGEQKGRCYFCEGTVTPDGTGCEWSCPAGQFGSLNECIDCDSTTNGGQSSRNSCQQCGNRFFDGDNALNGGCYLCSSKNTLFYVRQSDCLGCGNRYFIAREGDFSETGEQKGRCYFCEGTVTPDRTACE